MSSAKSDQDPDYIDIVQFFANKSGSARITWLFHHEKFVVPFHDTMMFFMDTSDTRTICLGVLAGDSGQS